MQLINKLYKKIPQKIRNLKLFSFLVMFFFKTDKVFTEDFISMKSKRKEFKISTFKLIYMAIKYGFYPKEYFQLELYKKAESEIKNYISFRNQNKTYGNPRVNKFPRNKYLRYSFFSSYFHRDVLLLDDKLSEEDYKVFSTKHESFIVKPIDGLCGKGIELLESKKFPNLSDIFAAGYKNFFAEELIIQGPELAVFHPSSVNTVRLVTTLNKDKSFNILCAFFRTGKSNSIVDNVGSGGYAALINEKNGVISSDGNLEFEYHEYHCDTNIKFKGFQLPDWDKLIEIAKEAHYSFPEQILIGWDFAWTNQKTWILVEANPLPSMKVCQILSGTGIIPKLKEFGIY